MNKLVHFLLIFLSIATACRAKHRGDGASTSLASVQADKWEEQYAGAPQLAVDEMAGFSCNKANGERTEIAGDFASDEKTLTFMADEVYDVNPRISANNRQFIEMFGEEFNVALPVTRVILKLTRTPDSEGRYQATIWASQTPRHNRVTWQLLCVVKHRSH